MDQPARKIEDLDHPQRDSLTPSTTTGHGNSAARPSIRKNTTDKQLVRANSNSLTNQNKKARIVSQASSPSASDDNEDDDMGSSRKENEADESI